MILVDTSAWYAALVQGAPSHAECRELIRQAGKQALVTDFIVDELLTLLSRRGRRQVAINVGPQFWDERAATLHRLTVDDVRGGWEIFRRYSDKQWSFTDCTSYSVMQRFGITEALALDGHFRQFGFVAVRP